MAQNFNNGNGYQQGNAPYNVCTGFALRCFSVKQNQNGSLTLNCAFASSAKKNRDGSPMIGQDGRKVYPAPTYVQVYCDAQRCNMQNADYTGQAISVDGSIKADSYFSNQQQREIPQLTIFATAVRFSYPNQGNQGNNGNVGYRGNQGGYNGQNGFQNGGYQNGNPNPQGFNGQGNFRNGGYQNGNPNPQGFNGQNNFQNNGSYQNGNQPNPQGFNGQGNFQNNGGYQNGNQANPQSFNGQGNFQNPNQNNGSFQNPQNQGNPNNTNPQNQNNENGNGNEHPDSLDGFEDIISDGTVPF